MTLGHSIGLILILIIKQVCWIKKTKKSLLNSQIKFQKILKNYHPKVF